MNLLSNLNNLILALLPFITAGAAYLYQIAVQRMPAAQRQTLEQFTKIAAGKIEQVYPGAGSENKKQLATELVTDLFKAFKLPAPDPRAIDAAIENAVLSINLVQQSSQTQDQNPLAPGAPNA